MKFCRVASRRLCLQYVIATLAASFSFQGIAGVSSITVIPDQVIMEQGHTTAMPFTVDSTNFTMQGSSSDPLLVPSTNIVFAGSGPSRTVTVTAAPNRFGQATITVKAVDDSGTALTTFLLTVNARMQIKLVQGQAVLSWSSTNAIPQQSDQLPGPWSDILPSITSPYVLPKSGPRFFQLRQE
jgi:hypothetical protein